MTTRRNKKKCISYSRWKVDTLEEKSILEHRGGINVSVRVSVSVSVSASLVHTVIAMRVGRMSDIKFGA